MPRGGKRVGAGRRHSAPTRRTISKIAATELDKLAEEWEVDADALLSQIVTGTPKDIIRAAADCIRDMGGAAKLQEPEDKPIIL